MVKSSLRGSRSVSVVVALALACLVGHAAQAQAPRPRADGLVDDFEGKVKWRARSDSGHAPAYVLSTDRAHSGEHSLRVQYTNGTPEWGSIETSTAITGEETALDFWLYVESAQEKGAMHIWLFEDDGDGWVKRVSVGGEDRLEALQGRWVEVRMPLAEFGFDPRGRGTEEREKVSSILINCNYADFVAYVDDVRFEVPAETQERLRAEEQERTRLQEEIMKRADWRRSDRGNIAIFRDEVPAPEQGMVSDPEYLGEVLTAEGYHVTFLTAREMVAAEVLRPELFDLVVLPYGPRFPSEAADGFRAYLREGGRFLSMGGYAFDEPYFLDAAPQDLHLVDNGGFEQAGEAEMPAGWFHHHAGQQGLVMRRDTEVKRSGDASLYISAPDDIPMTWYIARYQLDQPDRSCRYLLTASVRVRNIHDGPGAYIGVDFYRKNGERIRFEQTGIMSEPDTWHDLSLAFSVPPDTDHMTVNGILYAHGEAWFDDFDLSPVPTSINTRHATARDMLHITQDQIPVFDPSFTLERVAEVRAAEGQYVVPGDLSVKGMSWGYAAVGLWGQNTAVAPEPRTRWIPLLRAYDEYGHLQGTAGAMMLHHDGPWQGSAWAFFGLTDRDLFRRGYGPEAELLRRTVAHLLRGVYLSVPEPEMMCYRDGERVGASVLVANNGRAAQQVTVTAALSEVESGKAVGRPLSKTVGLEPGARETVELRWPSLELSSDLYRVRFVASIGEEAVDEVSTGFAVWRPEVVARGPDVRWENNCLRIGDEPGRFLCGTNQTGVVLGPWWENPLAWRSEMQYMRDWGLRVLRVLHISHFAGDLEKPEEKFLRRMDALVYLCQRQGIILFPCMHDWLGGIAIDAEVLRKESRFAQILAERYRDVPGIIIDVENEAAVGTSDIPELRTGFNDFLRESYGGDEAALKADWGDEAAFGQVPFARPSTTEGWTDVRGYLVNEYRRRLVDRWLASNVEAMREVDKRHAITDEYYLLPGGDAGKANRYCDFVNIHCYGIDAPAELKFYDHSAEGMGFSVGEFSRRSHPSFKNGWGWAPDPEVRRWYLHLVHACLGAGGFMVCNWDWKDMESGIFPWGLVYPCDLTPKSQFYIFRAASEFLSQVRLDYADPEVYVLIPDRHLVGAGGEHGWAPVRRCLELLERAGVPFGVLHDTNVEKLPTAAKVVFYPCPFVLDDETYARIERFVREGGTLYVSGDLSYDERRQRSKTSRLADLCGVEDGGVVYLPDKQPEDRPAARPASAAAQEQGLGEFPAAACVRVKPGAAEVLAMAGDQPALLRHALGQGQVFFCTDPLEYHAGLAQRDLYRYVLGRAGVEWLDVGDENLVVMLPPQREGRLAVAYNDAGEGDASPRLPGVTLRVTPRNWGLVAWNGKGEAYAIEGLGQVSAGEFRCVADAENCPVMVAAQDGSLETARGYTVVVVPIDLEPYQPTVIKVRLPALPNPRGTYGEYVEGQWRALGELKIRETEPSGWREIEVPAGLICRIGAQ